MPRVARVYTEQGVFHILTRGNNKQYVFHDDADFLSYKKVLKRLKNEQPFKLYHYCLMNNHVHMIIETNKKTELSKLMKRINLLYYHNYKKRYGYAGHFWQDRFKSLLIEEDLYLLKCGLYVERNPARANIVTSSDKYPYSSYNYYAYGKDDVILDRDPYYNELGSDDKARQLGYRRLILKEEDRIGRAVSGQLFLGGDDFIKRMEKMFKVVNVRLGRGRPKNIK